MKEQLLGDRYKTINVLGAGGMGQTFVAEDTQRPGNPKCVIKQLKPVSSDPNFLITARRLFKGEAEMLEKLGKHSQIPQLLAYFERDEEFYLVQEFIDGQPLSAELPLGERWSEPQVIALLKGILDILEFIHAQGVIHRDIKPDNIIRRREDGKLVLIDFGAVKQVRMHQATAVGQVSITVGIGTPGYMPTEQSSGKPRPSSDIYALGMVSIQALTGLLPSQLREDEDGEAIWREQAEVSDGLASVLTMMTRHYFKHRYQSASEVLQVLKDLESPGLATNRGYTPTQAANGSGYTDTGVAPAGYMPTQANYKEQAGSSRIERPNTQLSQIQQTPTLNQQQHPTVPQREPTRSSSSNRLLLAGACFLSVLVAGGLFYFNSTNQKVVEKPPISPTTPSLQASPSSPNPRSTPSPQASPSSSPSPVASPPLQTNPINPSPVPKIPSRDSEAEADAKRQREAEADAKRRRDADADAIRQREADADAKRRRDADADAKRRRDADIQQPANFQQEITANEATFIDYDVDGSGSNLSICRIPQGTKLVLTEPHLGSSRGPNDRIISPTAIPGCPFSEKVAIKTAHWSGL